MQLCSAGSVRRYILCLSGSGLESLETPLADGSLGSLPSETEGDKVSLGFLSTYISSPGETHSVGLVLRRSSLGCVLGVTLPLLLSFGTLLSRQVQKENDQRSRPKVTEPAHSRYPLFKIDQVKFTEYERSSL